MSVQLSAEAVLANFKRSGEYGRIKKRLYVTQNHQLVFREEVQRYIGADVPDREKVVQLATKLLATKVSNHNRPKKVPKIVLREPVVIQFFYDIAAWIRSFCPSGR